MVDLTLLQSVSYMAGALGVCVAAIFYVLNLRISQRNQELTLKAQQQTLETRQAQLFMPIYATFYSEWWQEAYNSYMGATFDGYDDYVAKYGLKANPDEYILHGRAETYLEGIGVLVKRGLIDPSFVDDLMSSGITAFWEKFKPVFLEHRVRKNHPQRGEYVEYLYNRIKPIVDSQHPELRKTSL
jgi:hypothetical protein